MIIYKWFMIHPMQCLPYDYLTTTSFSLFKMPPGLKNLLKFISIFTLSIILAGCSQPTYQHPHILIVTGLGDIEVELRPDKAPVTSASFLSYVDSGFYSNSSFYRVVMLEGLSSAGNTGLIQGGIWGTNDKQYPAVPGIVHESTGQTGLSHTSGAISLARTTPGSANTEFFICIGDQSQFDYGHQGAGDSLGFAAFGSVVKGMTVVRKIQQQRKDDQRFTEKITIKEIRKL